MSTLGAARKITFVSVMSGSPWGGSEQLWSETATRLSAKGHRITASVHHWPQMSPAVGRLKEACRVYERKDSPRLLDVFLRKFGQDPNLWAIRHFLKSQEPELVVISCGGFSDDLSWCEACQSVKVPYVLVAQAVAEMWWPSDPQAAVIRRAYEGAQKVYFVSDGNRRLVERMLGTGIPNAKVVRNPFNVPYTAECPYPPTDPTFNIACVSRLEPYAKGQDLLFEVLRLEKWKSRNLKVSLFGDGGNVESLKALARRYDLGNVHFQGFAGNIQEVWATHHLLIVPSRLEGLPLALVEAMLCGRAAVVTDVAGNTEVVDDGVTGFVAASPTPAHIDQAMERAWERRGSWGEMGKEAGRRIRQLVPADPAGAFADELLRLI